MVSNPFNFRLARLFSLRRGKVPSRDLGENFGKGKTKFKVLARLGREGLKGFRF